MSVAPYHLLPIAGRENLNPAISGFRRTITQHGPPKWTNTGKELVGHPKLVLYLTPLLLLIEAPKLSTLMDKQVSEIMACHKASNLASAAALRPAG